MENKEIRKIKKETYEEILSLIIDNWNTDKKTSGDDAIQKTINDLRHLIKSLN